MQAFFSRSLKLALVTTSLSLGLVTAPSLAQTTDAQTNSYQSNEVDSLGGSTFGNSFSPFDLIHNARFNNGRNGIQFYQDSQENINDAATKFKQQQQERLENQQQQQNLGNYEF